jgi:hypothetical protein
MNAIVAIGGPALFRVVDAYRAAVPSEVWILGTKTPRDPNDPLLRSLEALLEPFMDSYFAGEAQIKAAAIAAETASRPLAAGEAETQHVADAVSAILAAGLAPAMALVEMLDRAHALGPIEAVLTDGSTDSSRTAIAWAQARGLPAIAIPAVAPLRRPRLPMADRTFVIGARAQRAYRAIGSDESLLAALTPAQPAASEASRNDRAARRSDAKTAFTKALSWPAGDLLVVFEPAACGRDSALESATAFDASLAAMFEAFAFARAQVPALRLAIVTQPSPDGLPRASRAAAAAGVAGGEFAYAQADHDVWIGGADIVVSVDSSRSIEAALCGVPAINLWRPANWYLGPAFSAEDGVIDAGPKTLGGALVALAGDASLRAQIAAIAGERLAGEAPASASAVAAIAGELVLRRRPAVPRMGKSKPDIVIWAPDYSHASGGIRALFRLCHLLNMAGGDASMHGPSVLHPTWNAPRRDTPITERTIVVVPEIVFAHSSAKRIVRWVLNRPGLLGGPATYGPDEMVFYYASVWQAAAQAATTELLTEERLLDVFTVEPELFYNDRSRPRIYDCVYIGKGEQIYRRLQTLGMRDAIVIRRDQIVWPRNRVETAALLRGCRRLYSFDPNTAIIAEAVVCGAETFYIRENGELEPAYAGVSDYIERYYDLSHAKRFLRLVSERWD